MFHETFKVMSYKNYGKRIGKFGISFIEYNQIEKVI